MINNLVFLLNSPYPDYTGGRETWIYNVCNRLAESYHITIISQKKDWRDNDMGKFTNIDPRINIIQVSTLSSTRLFYPFVRSYLRFFNKWLLACRMKRVASKTINDTDKYVVISMDTVFMAYVGYKLSSKYPNVYHIASSRGPHAEFYAEDYPLIKKRIMNAERKYLKHADCIWANGRDTNKQLKIKGFESIVIRNGVDMDKAYQAQTIDLHREYAIPKEDKILVTIGTLQDGKGYNEIIKALSILKHDYNKNIHLIGVGKGNSDKYVELSKEKNVFELVHFVGEKRNTVEYAKSSDVVVCLSGGSGLGMACLESMAAKRPIVAWNSDVYTQLIRNKEEGLLVRAWDESALAEGIAYVLDHYPSCMGWAEKAYENVKMYDWSYVVSDIEEVLLNLENSEND